MNQEMEITPVAGDHVHLVQITDTHISTDAVEKFEGVDTTASLDRVIQRINAMEPGPDAILLTGDLAHHVDEAVYHKLLRQLSELTVPVLCLSGNHDDPDMMQGILNKGNVSTKKILDVNNWVVVLLDTWMPGSHSGRLSRRELAFLNDTLAARPGKHGLICLHHPPVRTGSPWMDAMMLENPGPFFNVVEAHDHVRGIVWGHIHQEFCQERGVIQLLGSPSTCVQFKPGTQTFTRDVLPPAFRDLVLHAEGGIETQIVWIRQPDTC